MNHCNFYYFDIKTLKVTFASRQYLKDEIYLTRVICKKSTKISESVCFAEGEDASCHV